MSEPQRRHYISGIEVQAGCACDADMLIGETPDEHQLNVHRVYRDDEEEETIQSTFALFHARNPVVYEQLLNLVMVAVDLGRTRVGIGQLFEVLRWDWMIAGLPDEHEQWKLNNNYRSRYARMMMREYPDDLAGIFETRELKSK